MFSSCDALPYHWNPASMAERVGLPLCNGSPTLNTLPHRFSVKAISPVSKSCGDGGVVKQQVEMRLTDHPSFGRFTQSASSALEEERRHQAVCQRTPPLSSLYPSDKCELPVPRLCTALQVQDRPAESLPYPQIRDTDNVILETKGPP